MSPAGVQASASLTQADTAVLIAVPIAVIALVSTSPMPDAVVVPNAAATAATIQAATITYSNDTTPSWSLPRVFTSLRNLRIFKRLQIDVKFSKSDFQ